jgi:hypothetical protein
MIQLHQEQAIPIRELHATAHPPPQHNQLMSERRVLCRIDLSSLRFPKDEPRVARVDFWLANGDSLVVEVPRYVLERLLVRAKRAIEAAPLLGRGRSTGHSVHSRDK